MTFVHISSGLDLQKQMTSVHISSGLALQRQMTYSNNTSGPAPQRKESSRPGPQLMTPRYISSGLVQNPVSPTPYVPPSKKDYEILAVDPADSPSSNTIDQDVPSTNTSPTNQEIQSQVTHQGVEELIHGHQNAQFDKAPLLHNLSSDPSSEETTL
ncbi:hypothetical protein Tco_1550298 [Tanacetum coccineum]